MYVVLSLVIAVVLSLCMTFLRYMWFMS